MQNRQSNITAAWEFVFENSKDEEKYGPLSAEQYKKIYKHASRYYLAIDDQDVMLKYKLDNDQHYVDANSGELSDAQQGIFAKSFRRKHVYKNPFIENRISSDEESKTAEEISDVWRMVYVNSLDEENFGGFKKRSDYANITKNKGRHYIVHNGLRYNLRYLHAKDVKVDPKTGNVTQDTGINAGFYRKKYSHKSPVSNLMTNTNDNEHLFNPVHPEIFTTTVNSLEDSDTASSFLICATEEKDKDLWQAMLSTQNDTAESIHATHSDTSLVTFDGIEDSVHALNLPTITDDDTIWQEILSPDKTDAPNLLPLTVSHTEKTESQPELLDADKEKAFDLAVMSDENLNKTAQSKRKSQPNPLLFFPASPSTIVMNQESTNSIDFADDASSLYGCASVLDDHDPLDITGTKKYKTQNG